MFEMLQEIGENSTKGTCYTRWCAQEIQWLEAGDKKALRVRHGSQRLLMPREPSMWVNSPRCAHVNEYPFSAGESEDDEMPGEENQWCALLDASYHPCYCSTWELPVP